MVQFRFPDAVKAVETWLDALGTAGAVKLHRSPKSKTFEWQLDLVELGYPISSVRLRISELFPAKPCELYVPAELCTKLPHVEEDGRVCLDEICQTADFSDPIAAVLRAVDRFKTELLENSANSEWCRKELHAERLSYWDRFCTLRRKSAQGRPHPRATLISMEPVDDWAEGQIAAFIPKGSRERRIDVQVVTLSSNSAVETANRHGFSSGVLVKGSAVFVRIPVDYEWTPSTWPRDFVDLENLVRTASSGQRSVIEWLAGTGWVDDSDDGALLLEKTDFPIGLKPLLVVLCHGEELYGYQISLPPVPRLTAPQIAPLVATRFDATWALTRGHAATTFHARRLQRVLVLGAGSLGSPVIDILARAGVGQIDIVDSQLFEPANVSRHLLGMSSIRQSKAAAIASRLNKDIPAITVRGHRAEAQQWMTENCTPGKFDLVLDLTAESSVRMYLSVTRTELFEDTVVIHAWVEPFCSAVHVVASTIFDPWPATDPVLECVNVADFTAASVKVNLPACSEGFHPYGSADIVQAAGFAAERIIDILDVGLAESTVWSSIRARAFFDALEMPVKTKQIVPKSGGVRDGIMITRLLHELLPDV